MEGSRCRKGARSAVALLVGAALLLCGGSVLPTPVQAALFSWAATPRVDPVPAAIAPSRPDLSPSRPRSRRSVVQHALALVSLPSAASAADKKPTAKDLVAQLEASIPKEERNTAGNATQRVQADHFPKIAFEGGEGRGKKIVFTVPHENLSPPDFSSIEFMWIKDEATGEIITAKKFKPSDPNLVITGFGSPGQKLTAASKDDKYGIWQGTFIVP